MLLKELKQVILVVAGGAYNHGFYAFEEGTVFLRVEIGLERHFYLFVERIDLVLFFGRETLLCLLDILLDLLF